MIYVQSAYVDSFDDAKANHLLMGMSDSQIEEILKSTSKATIKRGKKSKVITRAMVIGPDGKLKDAKDGGKGAIDLGKLLSEVEDGEVKKLLSENKNAIVSGKVVIIDADGNRTETDLKEGGNLDEMLKGTLDDMKLDVDVQVLGQDDSKPISRKDLSDKVDKLQDEMAAQRVLLEKILKKLN